MTDQNNELHEFKLVPADAKSPDQIMIESGHYKLPLPEQDKQLIIESLEKKHHFRLSIIEMLLFMFLLSLLLGIAKWLPFEVYTVGLGCCAMMLLFFDKMLIKRYRVLTICIFLVAYIVSVGWLIFTTS